MKERFGRNDKLRYFIGDVRDAGRLEMAMRGIDYVIHAAALKRIEAVEADPIEAVKTNIEGSVNVIEASLKAGVKKAIIVSTDKAVAPVNFYGSTKLCAERLFMAANNLSGGRCNFAYIRYGNVWASRGSVVEVWRRLKERGEPCPMTDPEATRFFITQDLAVKLIIDLISTTRCLGLVPILPAYRLGDLAEAMGVRHYSIPLGSYEKLHESLDANQTSDKATRLTVDELRRILDGDPYWHPASEGQE
jgi:UDP-N-acetylglucosamine 4,6-dehydratase